MTFLDPIYFNETGIAYALKNNNNKKNEIKKIQLQIGEISITMNLEDLKKFLQSVRSAKKGCDCKNCEHSDAYKTIKCDTGIVQIKFDSSTKTINDLEELVEKALFEVEFNSIVNNIIN